MASQITCYAIAFVQFVTILAKGRSDFKRMSVAISVKIQERLTWRISLECRAWHKLIHHRDTEVVPSKSCKFHSIGSAKADPYRVQNIVESCRGEPWLARTNTEIRYYVMMYLYSHYLLVLTEGRVDTARRHRVSSLGRRETASTAIATPQDSPTAARMGEPPPCVPLAVCAKIVVAGPRPRGRMQARWTRQAKVGQRRVG